MRTELTPKRIYLGLLSVIAFLLIANFAGMILFNFTVHDHGWGLITLFSFDHERSVPAFYSASAILAAALLLLTTGRLSQLDNAPALPWYLLGCIFLFLSFDEIASMHERLTEPMRVLFETSGVLYFAWVIPYGIAVLILGLVFVPFLMKLPRRTAKLFIVSGTLFMGGAIGVELIGAQHVELYGRANFTYGLIFTLEELLEKVGIATFIYGILDYLSRQFGLSANISTSP